MESGLRFRTSSSKARMWVKSQRKRTRIMWSQTQVDKGPRGEFGFYGISNGEGRKLFQQKRDMRTEMFSEDDPGWDKLSGNMK